MVEPQTSSQVLAKLEAEGYVYHLKAALNHFIVGGKDTEILVEHVTIDKIYRFEGEANPDDEEIIFAVSCPRHHLKAIYHVAYGPSIDALDADLVQQLKKMHKK